MYNYRYVMTTTTSNEKLENQTNNFLEKPTKRIENYRAFANGNRKSLRNFRILLLSSCEELEL